MTRKRITTKMRAQIFERHRGVCDICGGKISAGELWEVSHRIPLEAGGADDETNHFPAHKKCHRDQTSKIDIPMIAKVKRIRANHIGAKAPSRNPLPGSRASGFKRKMDGTVVPRRSK